MIQWYKQNKCKSPSLTKSLECSIRNAYSKKYDKASKIIRLDNGLTNKYA